MNQEIIDIIRKLVNHVYADRHAERDAMLKTLDTHGGVKVVEKSQPVPEPEPTYEELLAKHREARRGASIE